jgi:hypothetical protein
VSTLQRLLAGVQRHLLRERLAAAARFAAWGTASVAVLGALLHFVVRPVSPLGLLAALATPWLVAVLQAITQRARPAECAAWADRHLGGRSAYSTWLEITATSREVAAPAFAHLEAWLAESTPGRLAQLAAWPFDARLRKPLAAALVCSALALALLQLPARSLASGSESPQVEARSTATGASQRPTAPTKSARTTGAGIGDDGNAGLAALEQQRRDALGADANAGDVSAEADDDTGSAPRDSAQSQATERVTATGREAGDSPDPGVDTALTAPWQGELATQLRQISGTRERDALRADATRAADYEESSGASGDTPADAMRAAAATPPPARPALRLGPAEQAYLRAYFADSGATP